MKLIQLIHQQHLTKSCTATLTGPALPNDSQREKDENFERLQGEFPLKVLFDRNTSRAN